MIEFDAHKVMTKAYEFASVMVMQETKDEKLSVQKVTTLQSATAYGSKYGRTLVDSLVLGAILEYHSQLRAVLLEKGIDIGDFECD